MTSGCDCPQSFQCSCPYSNPRPAPLAPSLTLPQQQAGSLSGWGQSLTISIDATLGTPIAEGSTFSVDAKVDGLIPFRFSCRVCGANCTIKIPVVGKTVTFALPPCPITGGLKKTLTVALPAKSPIPVKTSIKGSATASDASGAKIADVSFTATIGPSASAAAELVLTERTDDAVPHAPCWDRPSCAASIARYRAGVAAPELLPKLWHFFLAWLEEDIVPQLPDHGGDAAPLVVKTDTTNYCADNGPFEFIPVHVATVFPDSNVTIDLANDVR